MWKVLLGAAAVFAVLVMGPRPDLMPTIDKQTRVPPVDELEPWLQAEESRYTDIIPGTEKHIVWGNAGQGKKTRYAVVYLHGLSASRQEISPVTERFAEGLDANLYLTRLAGHGRGSGPMGQVKVEQWLEDTWQAWQVAQQLGEQIIVVGTSTGGTLATWLAQQPEVAERLVGLVLISPNFGPKDKRAKLLTWPWAEIWVPWIAGKEHSWEPRNEMNARYWTSRYPINALHQMQALVEYVQATPVESIQTPTLFLYSHDDETVESTDIDRMFERWGASLKERVIIDAEDGQSHHVLAGDILSPRRNGLFVSLLGDFYQRIQR